MSTDTPFIVTAGVLFAVIAQFKKSDREAGVTNAVLLDALNDLTTHKHRKAGKKNKKIPADKTGKITDERQKRADRPKKDEIEASYFKSCARKDVSAGIFAESRVKPFKEAMRTPKGVIKRVKRAESLIKQNLFFTGDSEKQKDTCKQMLGCFRYIVAKDETIKDDDPVSLFESGDPMTKVELLEAKELCPAAVLLGLWYYVVLRSVDNREGRAAYEELFPKPLTNNSRRKWNESIDLSAYSDVNIIDVNLSIVDMNMRQRFKDAIKVNTSIDEIKDFVIAAFHEKNNIDSKTNELKYANKACHHLLLAYCELITLRHMNELSQSEEKSMKEIESSIKEDVLKQFDKYEKAKYKKQDVMENDGKKKKKVNSKK